MVSVSLGSSRRDHSVRVELLGQPFLVERRGTDGDLAAAAAIIAQLDGKVAAIGLGGIDLYLVAGGRRYVIRDALRLARAARVTPVVDGSGLKNTLERRVVRHLAETGAVPLSGRRVLLVSAVDRFGMAEALVEVGARLTMGDLIFALGIPVPLHTLRSVAWLARLLLPVICRLPFRWVYPTGSRQEEVAGGRRYERYFREADVVAGDFHFVRRYMPADLAGKVLITNTVTAADVDLLRERGVSVLVTTTPEFGGRSFGTNVLEAVLVALAGRRPDELTSRDYEDLLDRLGWRPRVELLQRGGSGLEVAHGG